MNISHLRTSVGYSLDLFRNQMQGSLSAQQKKVAAIALIILTTLALCYAAFRYCFRASEDSPILVVVPQPNAAITACREALREFEQKQEEMEVVEFVSDTGFLSDAEEYLKRWSAQSLITGASGPSEEVRRYLAAKINFHSAPTSDNQKIKDQYIDLENKIRHQYTVTNPDNVRFKFALDVLKTGILMNPEGYLALWQKARGMTEELRDPEDAVRSFFEKELL